MAKTKREYILATCFLSGTAAIISFVALGTQEWVTSDARSAQTPSTPAGDSVKIGLFGGVFQQTTAFQSTFQLTTVCAFDLNICALLCGDNMEDNLRRLYNNEEISTTDSASCPQVTATYSEPRFVPAFPRETVTSSGKIFINSGVWMCTIIFLILSGVMGLVCACLAVWNTAASPYQVYFSIFGLYIYNAVAFFCVLLSIVLWGAMFAADLLHNIPTYKTFLEQFTTDGYAKLGYSYWINLISLFFYMASICLLYIRNYLISKEPKVNVQIEDATDPVIYLY